jgi:integrase
VGDVDGSYTTLQTGAVSGTEYTLTGRNISVKITVNKGTSTNGPVLKRHYIRAAPVVWLRDVRKVGGETATGALRALSGLLTYAVDEELISQNPVAALPKKRRPKRKSPKSQRKEHRFLKAEERDRLLGAMTPTYEPVAFVAVWTGLRENEVLGLTWGDVDLKDKKIHLRAQLSRPMKDHPAVRVSLKTEEIRDVDILNPDLGSVPTQAQARIEALAGRSVPSQEDHSITATWAKPSRRQPIRRSSIQPASASSASTIYVGHTQACC